MQGFKTIIINVVALLIMVATYFGLDIPEELEGENLAIGVDAIWISYSFVMAIINLVLRFFTKTPIFKKE